MIPTSTSDILAKLATLKIDDAPMPMTTTQTTAKSDPPPSPFFTAGVGLQNVASASAGARILFATDDWFAKAECLLNDAPPVFDPNAFCLEGKVMDGWETRRKREPGHDWCLISLCNRSHIFGIEIDTAYFTGNNVPAISIEVVDLSPTSVSNMVSGLPGAMDRLLHGGQQGVGCTPEEVEAAQLACRTGIEWIELLAKAPLCPGYEETRLHYFTTSETVGTHLRVNYYPDGGVARLRIWGTEAPPHARDKKPIYLPITTGKLCTVVPHSTTDSTPSQQSYDYPEISCLTLGGVGLGCSNKHYGEPWQLIQPNLGKDMGDGWETARHPSRPSILFKDKATGLVDSPLKDWGILKLGKPAVDGVARIILDTKHFRGNYPESVLVEGAFVESYVSDDTVPTEANWFTLVPRTRMSPDSEHVFERVLEQLENSKNAVTHVRVSIFPDGGISRVRVYGKA